MISLKTKHEIATMRDGGRILAEILKKLSEAIKPGIATEDIDKLARELVLFYKVKPAFLGYGGFPAAICISLNDQVVHGIPSKRIIENGDLVSVDMGVAHKNLFLDAAVTVPAVSGGGLQNWAQRNPERNELLETTKMALQNGIEQARIGNKVGHISDIVQKTVEDQGFNVVRDLVGHGVGYQLHEEPQVPNFGSPDQGPVLKEGMVLAIEPMVVAGDWRVEIDRKNKWTCKTVDGSWAAHFEHTVAITKNGPEILTVS